MDKNDALYAEDELSARRLIRLHRYNIQNFIKEQKKPSYLWTKYSIKKPEFSHCCFPGAEHLIENQDEALYLLDTYKNLDLRMNTKFCVRIQRVFIARNIFKPDDIVLNKYLWQLITTTKQNSENSIKIINKIVKNIQCKKNMVRKIKKTKKLNKRKRNKEKKKKMIINKNVKNKKNKKTKKTKFYKQIQYDQFIFLIEIDSV